MLIFTKLFQFRFYENKIVNRLESAFKMIRYQFVIDMTFSTMASHLSLIIDGIGFVDVLKMVD